MSPFGVILVMDLLSRLMSVVYVVAEFAAQYPIGQSLIYNVDKVFWCLEKTSEWMVPKGAHELNSSKRKELIIPLPLVFFLCLLVTLQFSVLFGLLMGSPPFLPAHLVTYFKGKRRYLQSLKYQGLRRMRWRSTQGTQGNGNIYNQIKTLIADIMSSREAEAQYLYNNGASPQYIDDKDLINKAETTTSVVSDEETEPMKTSTEAPLAAERTIILEPSRATRSIWKRRLFPQFSWLPIKTEPKATNEDNQRLLLEYLDNTDQLNKTFLHLPDDNLLPKARYFRKCN